MPRKKPTFSPPDQDTYRLVLHLPRDLIYHIKARAAADRITASALVAQWVRSWAKAETRRPGGRP